MIKRLNPPYDPSSTDVEETQLRNWILDSHFWEEKPCNIFVCKLCGEIMPTLLPEKTHFCPDNPAIKQLKEKFIEKLKEI